MSIVGRCFVRNSLTLKTTATTTTSFSSTLIQSRSFSSTIVKRQFKFTSTTQAYDHKSIQHFNLKNSNNTQFKRFYSSTMTSNNEKPNDGTFLHEKENNRFVYRLPNNRGDIEIEYKEDSKTKVCKLFFLKYIERDMNEIEIEYRIGDLFSFFSMLYSFFFLVTLYHTGTPSTEQGNGYAG
jgi:hypothetical protein